MPTSYGSAIGSATRSARSLSRERKRRRGRMTAQAGLSSWPSRRTTADSLLGPSTVAENGVAAIAEPGGTPALTAPPRDDRMPERTSRTAASQRSESRWPDGVRCASWPEQEQADAARCDRKGLRAGSLDRSSRRGPTSCHDGNYGVQLRFEWETPLGANRTTRLPPERFPLRPGGAAGLIVWFSSGPGCRR